MTSLFKPPLPVLISGGGGGGGSSGSSISIGSSAVSINNNPGSDLGSVQILTNGTPAVNIDNDQYVIIGNKNGITPTNRLTVVDPIGRCIQLINSARQSSVSLTANNNRGLTIETSGSNIQLETNNVYFASNSIYIGSELLIASANQLNYNVVSPGTASANKSLVLDSNRNIANINSLTASLLNGVIQTPAQPNITSLNNVNITSLSLGGISISATSSEINFLSGVNPGTASPVKALVLNASRNIQGINLISAAELSGVIQTAAQPNITSLGHLTNLRVDGTIGIGNVNPTKSIDILSSSPSIRMSNGSHSTELSIDVNGSYRINPDRDIIIANDKHMMFGGTSSINGLNTLNAVNLFGSIQTASQPNITAIGALTTLSVLGDTVIGSTSSPSSSRRLIVNEPNGQCITLARSIAIRCDLNINNQGDLELNLHRDLRILNGGGIRMAGPITGITNMSANTITGLIQTAEQPNITAVGTLGSLNVLDDISAATVSANTLTGTLQTSEQPNITTIGTLNSLNVINAITAASIQCNSVFGIIETANQHKITSVGTLNSLNVSNGITAASVSADILIGTLTTTAQPNITSVGPLISLVVSNAISADSVSANSLTGTILTPLQPNITSIGTLSSLNVVHEVNAASVVANSIIGTVLTPEQPQITSLGNLTSLNVNGLLSAESIDASSLSGTLTTSIQNNITSIGTLSKLLTTGPIGIGVSNPTSALDINTSGMTGISSEIKLTDGINNGSIRLGNNGITINTNGPFLTLASGVGLRFINGGITGLTDITASEITGTLQTAHQPNITSLGSLNYLDTSYIGVGTGHTNQTRINVYDSNGQMMTMSNGDRLFIASIINGDFTFNTSNDRLALATDVSLVLNGGTIIGLNNLIANTLAGTIITPAQPNITSLGNLSSLTVAGGLTANDAIINNANITGDLSVGGSLILSTPLSFTNLSSQTGLFDSDIPATSITNGGTLTVIGGASFSRNVFIGTSLTLGTATITESTLLPLSGLTPGIVNPDVLLSADSNKNLTGFNDLTANNLFGQIQTAFQPNITTIGNLSNLNVAGYLGVGTFAPIKQLEINSLTGDCLRLSHDKDSTPLTHIDISVDATGNGLLTASGSKITIEPQLQTTQIILGNSTNSIMPLEIGFTPFAMTERYAFNTSANGKGIFTPREPFPIFNYSIRALGRILCTQSLDVMSDRRTKNNINELSDEFCTSFVEKTKPVSFHWNEGDSAKSFGYIAQDLIRAGFTDLVNLAKDDHIQEEIDDDGFINPAGVKFTVSYQHIIPILAKNQQRLMKENEELKAKLDAILNLLNKKENE